MRFFFAIAILVFFCQCGSENNSKKPLAKKTDSIKPAKDMAEIKDTTTFVEQKIVFDKIPPSHNIKDRLVYFKEKYLVNYTEINPEELKVYVLDRFTSDKKYKLHLQKKSPVKYGKTENVFPVINIRAYVYTDSAQCANALNNWYNCFGNDCSTIVSGVNTMLKTTPGYYIINPTSIICLDYLVEHAENNWNEVIAHLKKLFVTKGSIIIDIKPQGKLKWELL